MGLIQVATAVRALDRKNSSFWLHYAGLAFGGNIVGMNYSILITWQSRIASQ